MCQNRGDYRIGGWGWGAGRVKYNSVGSNSRGFTNCLSSECRAYGRDLLEEMSMSKSPLLPMSRKAVVTNDWCIK